MIVLALGTIILLQTIFLSWLISRDPEGADAEPVLRVSDLPAATPDDMATKAYVDNIGSDVTQQTHDNFVNLSEAVFEVVEEQEEWLKGRLNTLIVRVEAAEDLSNNILDILNGLTERLDDVEHRPQTTTVVNTQPPPPVEVAEVLVERIEGPTMEENNVERVEPVQEPQEQPAQETEQPEPMAELKETRADDAPLITDLRAVPLDADPEVRAHEAYEGHHDLPPMTGDYEIMGQGGPTGAQQRAADRARRGVRGFPR